MMLFLVFHSQSQDGNLKDCQMKNSNLFIQQIKVFRKLLWNKSRLRFEGSCLKQKNTAPFTPNNVVTLYISYELEKWSPDLINDFTLNDCYFGAVKRTKNAHQINTNIAVMN